MEIFLEGNKYLIFNFKREYSTLYINCQMEKIRHKKNTDSDSGALIKL